MGQATTMWSWFSRGSTVEHQQFELHQGQRSPKEVPRSSLLLLPSHAQGGPLGSVHCLNHTYTTLTWGKTGSVQLFISSTNPFPSKFLLAFTYCAMFWCILHTAEYSSFQGHWSPAKRQPSLSLQWQAVSTHCLQVGDVALTDPLQGVIA